MAHMIETMAYAGETPWHGLGNPVNNDLTPDEMLKAAQLDWSVEKVPAFANINGKDVPIGRQALVRDRDNKILDIVSDDWNPVQNAEAFDFFSQFVDAGHMEMHTAGSLRGGQITWALAKVNDSFELFKGDRVDSYLLFTNPHTYGASIDVRLTPIRVVCNNTLTLSLSKKAENMVKMSHRRKFDPEVVAVTLGVAKEKLNTYKEAAAFLGSKKYKAAKLTEYYKEIFPLMTTKAEKENKVLSRNASRALDVLKSQPGHEFAPGTWWQAFNAVTYMTDHLLGRNTDNRLTSAWFGTNRMLKTKALQTAVKFAEAA